MRTEILITHFKETHMQSNVSFAWPPLKSIVRPLPNRPLPRQRRDLRPEKGFGRYWQRLMRKHRQHMLIRKNAVAPRLRIPAEFGDQARWYAVSV